MPAIDAELDGLCKRSRSYMAAILPEIDPQLTTLLHRYMCVLISSNIDKSIHLMLTEYARTRGSNQLRSYVSKRYARGTNYNSARLIESLNLFDPAWGRQIEEKLVATDLKEKLDSIYGIRNSIAHGVLVNISRPSLDGYVEAHEKIIGMVKSILLT
jgi:hypothetical protein